MIRDIHEYYWKGHGPLWKIYWVYGVVGCTSLGIALLLLVDLNIISNFTAQFALIPLADYTIWVVVSIWRCAFNVGHERYGHIARALAIPWAINTGLVLSFLEMQFLGSAI